RELSPIARARGGFDYGGFRGLPVPGGRRRPRAKPGLCPGLWLTLVAAGLRRFLRHGIGRRRFFFLCAFLVWHFQSCAFDIPFSQSDPASVEAGRPCSL